MCMMRLSNAIDMVQAADLLLDGISRFPQMMGFVPELEAPYNLVP